MVLAHLEKQLNVGMPRFQVYRERPVAFAAAVVDDAVLDHIIVLFRHLEVIDDTFVFRNRHVLDRNHHFVLKHELARSRNARTQSQKHGLG